MSVFWLGGSFLLLQICCPDLQVLVVVFGQELPDATSSVFEQTFSIVVASVGLGTFALVLALVEQVVLEVSLYQSRHKFILLHNHFSLVQALGNYC